MTDGAQLNGVPVQYGTITLPYYGPWHADVRLMGTTDPTGPQSLTFAGITYSCSVFRRRAEVGALALRLIAGAGGWRAVLPARAYSSPNNVMLSVVLQDLAAEAGETIIVDADRSLGQAYVRAELPAAQTLNILTDSMWWMGPDGVTRTGPRDLSPIGTDFTAMKWRGASGIYAIAPVVPSDWTPGRNFSNTSVSGTISRLEHTIESNQVRSIVMIGETEMDRLKDPITSIVDEAKAGLLYYIPWAYTVDSVSPGPPVTMTLLSNDTRMPNLQRVVLWPGPSGAWAVPPQGATVRVGFVAGDPSQPMVIGLDPNHPATSVTIGGSVPDASPAAARKGDDVTITVAEIAGHLTANLSTGAVTATSNIGCKITSGSSKVVIG